MYVCTYVHVYIYIHTYMTYTTGTPDAAAQSSQWLVGGGRTMPYGNLQEHVQTNRGKHGRSMAKIWENVGKMPENIGQSTEMTDIIVE